MTSTSFNVGLANNKNSSRVTKPPGGGHTDIFGIHDNGNDISTPSKRRHIPPTTITSCFAEEERTNTKKVDNSHPTDQTNGNSQNENVTTVDNGKTDENQESQINENVKPKPEEKVQVPTPRRQRVPPGGFSSGLW